MAKAAKKAAKKSTKTRTAASKAAPEVDTSWPITPTAPPPGRAKVNPVFSSAIDEAVEEALHPPEPQKSRPAAKKSADAKKDAPTKRTRAKKDPPTGRRGGRNARVRGEGSSGQDGGRQQKGQQKQRSVPPPAVNDPLTFINFVAAFAVGSTIEGEVVSFTSHGAMVDVALPGGGEMHCYIPLTAMGTPPPTKARQVLKKGEMRPFVLAGLDPPRRVAELAIPSVVRSAPTRAGTRRGLAGNAVDAPAIGVVSRATKGECQEGSGKEGRQEEGSQEGCGQEGCGQEGSRADKEGKQEGCSRTQEGRTQEGASQEGASQEGRSPRRPASKKAAKKTAKAKAAPATKAAAKKAGKAQVQ